MRDLTVSIINHNSVAPLQKCLDSLLPNLNGLETKVYVVDNLCEERAGPMLAKLYPQVEVIGNTQTLGFGANHNQVLKRCQQETRYVLLLNPDTVLPPRVISRLLDFMRTHPEAAAVSPGIEDEHGQPVPTPRRAIHTARDLWLLTTYISNTPRAQGAIEKVVTRWRRSVTARLSAKADSGEAPATNNGMAGEAREVIRGTALLINAQALASTGLFDEDFFLYFEEYDWCFRARQAGWQVFNLPAVVITHVGGHSTFQRNYFKYFLILIDSWLLFYGKQGGWGRRSTLVAWLTLVALINWGRWSALWPAPAEARTSRRQWREFSTSLLRQLWKQPARAAR
jgi:GT2 family glycosyltransferase